MGHFVLRVAESLRDSDLLRRSRKVCLGETDLRENSTDSESRSTVKRIPQPRTLLSLFAPVQFFFDSRRFSISLSFAAIIFRRGGLHHAARTARVAQWL